MASETLDILDLLGREAVRRIALDRLDEAAAAVTKLRTAADGEALHDVRVATRRLRVLLRAHRDDVRDTLGKRWERRLRELTRRTSESREVSVARAWLETRVRSGLLPGEDPTIAAVIEHLSRAEGVALASIGDELPAQFAEIEPELRVRLSAYHRKVCIGRGDPAESRFSQVEAAVISAHSHELWLRLSALNAASQGPSIHAARIAAKRLRYLLEPLRGLGLGARRLVAWLKRLQDALGDVHDMHVLEARLPDLLLAARPGEAPEAETERRLRRAIADHATARFAAFEELWTGGSAATFLADLHRLTTAMARRTPGEWWLRTFLLRRLPRVLRGGQAEEVRIGWLPGERIVERVVHRRSQGAEVFLRIVQPGDHGDRVEEAVSREQFARLYRLTRGRRLRKRVYVLDERDHPTWAIERIVGSGMILARTRSPGAFAIPPAPASLTAEIQREVSSDPAYEDAALAG